MTVNLRSGEWEKAVKLFREMQFCYGKVYDGTMVKLLQVCSNKGGFAEGRQIHGYKGAIEILRRMQVSGLKPNSTSITSLLQAVAEPGLLSLGKAIHGYVIRNQLCYDVYVETTLIDMYVKTGCLPYVKMVSDTMAEKKNIVAWNSLISGLSYAGLMKLLPS